MKKLFVVALAALATLTASAQTFGRVNFQELVMLAPEMDSAREAIAASQKEAEETYSAMVEEYQGKLNQYQQKQATWTAAIRESKERELMEIQNRIQEFQQSISQELQQQQAQLDLQDQQKTLYQTIEGFWQDANTNQQRFRAALTTVESEQMSYDLLEEKFNLGLTNIIELMNGKDKLLNAQQNKLQSKYQTILNQQLLKFYQGDFKK